MGLKAVFFDLDDTLYSSFQEGDQYAYEKLAMYAEAHLGVPGEQFARAFRDNRRRLARQQPGMPPTHDRVLFAQGALESLGPTPSNSASMKSESSFAPCTHPDYFLPLAFRRAEQEGIIRSLESFSMTPPPLLRVLSV